MTTRTRRAEVADQLLHGIKTGAYPAGQKLPSERRLSEDFAVSRPVVREALGMLSSLGLVDIQIGRGAYVTDREIAEQSRAAEQSLIEITIARETIEAGAIAMVSGRKADPASAAEAQSAFDELQRCAEAGLPTTKADHRLHRAIVSSVGSRAIVDQWEDLTQKIGAVVQVSPGGGMDAATIERHRTLLLGILGGDRDSALRACHDLHDDYRRFLRDLLG